MIVLVINSSFLFLPYSPLFIDEPQSIEPLFGDPEFRQDKACDLRDDTADDVSPLSLLAIVLAAVEQSPSSGSDFIGKIAIMKDGEKCAVLRTLAAS